jgi:hypothetical protein
VTNFSTGIEDPLTTKEPFLIYNGYGFVNIQPLSDEWNGVSGSVTLYTITGNVVSDLRNTVFVKNMIISIPSPDVKGVYLVDFRSGIRRYTGKVVIK